MSNPSRDWLRQGLAGELGYMERTEALRRDPRELVPWAASVISVGHELLYRVCPADDPMTNARAGFRVMPGATIIMT